MIIVEGPDGAGKTTLVERIFETFSGLAVMHSPGPDHDVVERVHEALAYEVKAGNRPVVHDRLYWSELIYGEILRGEVAFNGDQREFIERTLGYLGVPIIFCLPQFDRVHTAVMNSEQMDGVHPAIGTIYQAYKDEYARADEHFGNGSGLNVMRYDYEQQYTGPLPLEIYNAIAEYLSERRAREWTPKESPSSSTVTSE